MECLLQAKGAVKEILPLEDIIDEKLIEKYKRVEKKYRKSIKRVPSKKLSNYFNFRNTYHIHKMPEHPCNPILPVSPLERIG